MTTAAQEIVHVDLGERSYDIHIGAGNRDRLGELIAPVLAGGKVLIIADETVAGHHSDAVLGSLKAAGIEAVMKTFPAGEPSKSIEQAQQLWQACADERIDRAGAIIALGGGVSGDLAGFVAATWMRGVRFVQIPTSLLAMVDSSVGGKTGVNSAAGKNLIGSFKQPDIVVIDPNMLNSMNDREYRAGLAEILKYGIIKDADFLAWQENNGAALAARDTNAVIHAVATSCRIKAWYVQNDEQEHGVRAHLNYGHTFGHAIERQTKYRTYLHGEAVAIGMEMAIDAADRLGMLTENNVRERQRALCELYQLPTTHQAADVAAEAQALCDLCVLDKKVRAGKTRFVLPTAAGSVESVTSPDPALITAAFASCITSS